MAVKSQVNRPYKWGAKDRREYIVADGEVALRAQNDGSGNAIYIGKAKEGTLTSEAKWQISFQVYDGNDSITSRTWPQDSNGNASTAYEFEWDERLTYTYS